MKRPHLPNLADYQKARMWLLVATVSFTALFLVAGRQNVASLIASVLFFSLGILQNHGLARPHRTFRRVFLESTASLPPERTFLVVLPTFHLTRQTEDACANHTPPIKRWNVVHNRELDKVTQANDPRSTYDTFPIYETFPIIANGFLSKSDSTASGQLSSVIVSITGGQYRPEFVDDGISHSHDDTRPALVVGCFSNAWVQEYWKTYGGAAIFRPLAHQGFEVIGSDKKYYPEDDLGRPIFDFYQHENQNDAAATYGLIARVSGSKHAQWIVCGGIGPGGTEQLANWLTGTRGPLESELRSILRSVDAAQYFVLVYKLTLLMRPQAKIEEVYRWTSNQISDEWVKSYKQFPFLSLTGPQAELVTNLEDVGQHSQDSTEGGFEPDPQPPS